MYVQCSAYTVQNSSRTFTTFEQLFNYDGFYTENSTLVLIKVKF